ncbi:hypothetical protein CNE_1c13470 [Cupriavidus necator N-1]|uniref:Uncharacterized protein n=1 Tax=Cupriavidus necator (strain ATCC 43291 / DSM 13513 / CCUG 52238 / LMG 8453 / N-1) TaxID=1042878 RepID=G0ES78_CUPNN|nr:hypothetical protein CNE_1c13470 [Cupriavidus necator N-1]
MIGMNSELLFDQVFAKTGIHAIDIVYVQLRSPRVSPRFEGFIGCMGALVLLLRFPQRLSKVGQGKRQVGHGKHDFRLSDLVERYRCHCASRLLDALHDCGNASKDERRRIDVEIGREQQTFRSDCSIYPSFGNCSDGVAHALGLSYLCLFLKSISGTLLTQSQEICPCNRRNRSGGLHPTCHKAGIVRLSHCRSGAKNRYRDDGNSAAKCPKHGLPPLHLFSSLLARGIVAC